MKRHVVNSKRQLTIKAWEAIAAQDARIRFRQATNIINQFIIEISNVLAAGERVEFRGLGNFRVIHVKQRMGQNPRHPEQKVVIPAHRAIKFKTSTLLKARMSKKAK